ncbi:FecR family protein [Spirulina sp. CS-785/01]|uniref:FecR family protein n=1 Tax=Spirulina sp. CS-785/01 TaxID=3021716 RepID=UPI0023310D00|nr:FecR family protein [Spirulina sp. CS-785/01]MDB9314669.1 FecR family protein [Spirulina sp. CS-785/01]
MMPSVQLAIALISASLLLPVSPLSRLATATPLAATETLSNRETNRNPQQERYVRIQSLEGTVTYNGNPVQEGDRIPVDSDGPGLQTGENSRVTLEMDDTIGTVSLDENSQLRVTGLEILPSGGKTTQMYLAQGRSRAKIRDFNNPDSSFDIDTPSGNAGVRGTEFGLVVLPDGETRMAVVSGRVVFRNAGEEVQCESGFGAIAEPEQPPTGWGQVWDEGRVRLEVLSEENEGKVRLEAQISPVNFVSLNGNSLEANEEGRFISVIEIPDDGILRVEVTDPLRQTQVYELVVPSQY